LSANPCRRKAVTNSSLPAETADSRAAACRKSVGASGRCSIAIATASYLHVLACMRLRPPCVRPRVPRPSSPIACRRCSAGCWACARMSRAAPHTRVALVQGKCVATAPDACVLGCRAFVLALGTNVCCSSRLLAPLCVCTAALLLCLLPCSCPFYHPRSLLHKRSAFEVRLTHKQACLSKTSGRRALADLQA